MQTLFTGGPTRLWYYAGEPDDSVHNSEGAYAEFSELFLNTSASKLYFCTQGGEGTQTWIQLAYLNQVSTLIGEIPQADWTQSDSEASDYIKNKPSLSFSTPTFSSATSATQLSSTRPASVLYTFPTSMTSLVTSQTLTATLEYADDSGFTTNVVTVNSDVQGCSGILSLVLSGRLQVQGTIPAGKYRRVVLGQTGGATVPTTLSSGQEVLL